MTEGNKYKAILSAAAAALLLLCAAYLSNFNVPHPLAIAYDIHRNLRSTEYVTPLAFNDPKSVTPKTVQPRAAIVASICAGVDHKGSSPTDQIRRAESMARTLVDHGSTLPRILLVSGFDFEQYNHLLKNKDSDEHYGFDRIVNVPYGDLALKLRQKGDGVYAANDLIQDREDGTCTTLKFYAWELQDEFDVVFHTDTDVCFGENPDPYILNFMENSDKSLQAFCERKERGWTGFNVHLMMFRPNKEIGKLLRLKAAWGDYIAFTNTEQDVIESVYSPSSQCVTEVGRVHSFFPEHHHGKRWAWNGKTCYKMW